MTDKKIVVVGYDGSGTASEAVKRAIDLTEMMEANLHIVLAYDTGKSGSFEEKTNAKIALDKVERAKSLVEGRVPVDAVVIHGTPGQALVEHAEALNASLIVVGNKNMQGMRRIFGSVGSDVSHNAPCDVYVAKTID